MKRLNRRPALSALLVMPLVALALAAPAHGAAQAVPESTLERLSGVLPAGVMANVLERVAQAEQRGLPTRPLTSVALEGATKGRSAAETLGAVDALLADLGRAEAALRGAERAPLGSEIEAAAVAMRMGVDGEAVSALARTGPSGRSLSVPLLVMGGLSQRGLPSDQALGRVLQRLADRADDAALVGELGLAPAGRAGPPAEIPGLGDVPGGVPGPGVSVPVGPPDGVGPPSDRPGRGGPPDLPLPGRPGGD